jgi:hypothetical protein
LDFRFWIRAAKRGRPRAEREQFWILDPGSESGTSFGSRIKSGTCFGLKKNISTSLQLVAALSFDSAFVVPPKVREPGVPAPDKSALVCKSVFVRAGERAHAWGCARQK